MTNQVDIFKSTMKRFFLTFFCALALIAVSASGAAEKRRDAASPSGGARSPSTPLDMSEKAQELAFNGGTACRQGEGVVVRQGSRTLDVCAYFVSRGWGFKPIKDSLTRVTVEDGALRMSFSAVSPPDAR